MLTKSIFNNSNVLQEKRDYIGNFEYVGGVLESVMHSEGRYRSATARHEYTMKDHLGNTRLVYSDANNDGIITVNTEILQETHYYPFGEQGCSSHMKWLVAEVKRSFRPAEDRGAISVVWNLYATAKELLRIGVPRSLHPAEWL